MDLIGGIVGIAQLAGLIGAVVGLVDAARRPEDVFPAVGKQTKKFWLIVLAVSAFAFVVFGPVSLLGLPAAVATIVYFVDVRPAVSQTTGGGPYGGW